MRRLPCGHRRRAPLRQSLGADVLLLVVGDRSANDEVTYPEVDLHGKLGADGKYIFTRKDGTPY